MQRISSGELIRNFGRYSDAALGEPVVITRNGRERLVLLNVDEYNLLCQISALYEDLKKNFEDLGRDSSPMRGVDDRPALKRAQKT